MTVLTPCSDPANDPNDWFIEKDGKQYRDDEVLTEDEVHALSDDGNGGIKPYEEVVTALEQAMDEKIRLALIRRRKARDACYECPIRTQCLGQRLETKIEYGTWGGYYPEELRKIEDERDRREALRR